MSQDTILIAAVLAAINELKKSPEGFAWGKKKEGDKAQEESSGQEQGMATADAQPPFELESNAWGHIAVNDEESTDLKRRTLSGISTCTPSSRRRSSTSSDDESFRLSKIQATTLIDELLHGFSAQSFQKKLNTLVEQHFESDLEKATAIPCLSARQELAFSVQSEVIHNYGFSCDEDGVIAMKTALREHLDDEFVLVHSEAIRSRLRLPQMVFEAVNTEMDPDVADLDAEKATPVDEHAAAKSSETPGPKTFVVAHGTDKTMPRQHVSLSYPYSVRVAREVLVERFGKELTKDMVFVMKSGSVWAGMLEHNCVFKRFYVMGVCFPDVSEGDKLQSQLKAAVDEKDKLQSQLKAAVDEEDELQ